MYTSIPDKIQQEIISNVDDVFIFYHIVLIDMLDRAPDNFQVHRTKYLQHFNNKHDTIVSD
jgi:hypothetical protein